MPESPEIIAQAQRLGDAFGGCRLSEFRALSFTAMKTYDPAPDSAIGSEVSGFRARGKYLVADIGDVSFVVHLMQGGRLEPDPKQSAKPRGGLARWVFDNGDAMLLAEQSKEKKAGVWVVAGDLETQPPIQGLGPDAVGIDAATVTETCGRSSRRLHGLLRDQRELAGIGRRLANEICHRAKLSPFANASKLTPAECAALCDAMEGAIAESLAFESAQDHMVKSKDRPAQVHKRTGEECPQCGDTIGAVEYRSYTVNYCPACQTGGKVLADNTTSKFLK